MGDDGHGTINDVISTVKRLGIPILMVQSTEDALIGSPLALLLKREVCLVRETHPKCFALRSFLLRKYVWKSTNASTETRARAWVLHCLLFLSPSL